MAQSNAAVARIAANVDESSLITLGGNVPLLARAQYDQGEALASTQLTHIRLVLSRSGDQQAALDQYLAELQDKSSPNYHKWLTPEQFGKLYGPADSDVATIVAWLESHGLKLEAVSTGRTNIAFSGTASQVGEAFHTSIHSFQANGEQFYSNTTDPRIPSALVTVVKGVAHLNTIKPRPQSVPGRMGMFDPSTGRMAPVSSSTSGARPNLTYEDTSGYQNLYVVPGDAATIYDTPNTTLNANYTSGTNYTGSGVTIGVGGDSAIQTQYVTAYRSLFLGDSTAPTVTNVDAVSENNDNIEAYLDTEIAGGLAPGATIHLYISSDLNSAIERAISDNTVDIFSLSFGQCELGLSTSDNAMINGWWEQMAAQGIAVTVSSGDSGSAGCDNPNSATVARYGLQVSGFASTPYNIAVGGTDYYPLANSFSTYVTPATSAGSAAGSSATFYRTALSYIPESTWNDSTVNDTTISANVPWTGSYASIWGGSGGASKCSTNTSVDNSNGTVTGGSCTSGYSKPAWQRGTGVPADGVRDIPDVSLLASSGFQYRAQWLMCYPYTYQGVNYQWCIRQANGSWYFGGVGGTSASAPAFAGILALVQQKTGSRLGQAAANLYNLYNGSHASAIFHDVTVGNIAMSCVSGTVNCTRNTAGYYFESGYDTTAGYDLATGLGSVDVAQLLKYWVSATGSAAATVNVTPSSSSITNTQSLTVTVSVTGSSGTPTGTVTLFGGGYTTSAQTLTSGGYTFNIAAGSLTVGTDTLTVTYSGDATYATKTGTTTVTVSGLTPIVTVTPNVTSLYSSQSLIVTGTVSGTGATPTGTVTLTGGGYASAAVTLLVNGNYTITTPAYSLNAGADVLTVSYSGNVNYAPASKSTTVTVTQSVFTLAASVPAAIASPGGSTTSTVTVSTTTGYSGSVTLTCALTSYTPSTAIYLPSCSGGTVTLSSGVTTGNATMIVTTTAASAEMVYPKMPGKGSGWAGAGGGAVLAFLVFLGIPARQRSWRQMLGVLVLMAAPGSLAACGGGGGGGSGGGGGGGGIAGTTLGTYTFTVTGTGSPLISPTPSSTFTVTVN